MRRMIAARLKREDGVVAVIVAVAMVVLLGAAAFTVDIGSIYAERTQLQNGADAAAIAVAQGCAAGVCGNMQATAQNLANRNSNDGASNVSVDLPQSNQVHVKTWTRDAVTGAGALNLAFAPVLGTKTATVAAEATAGWGSPASGPADVALAFAPCVFQLTGIIQVIGFAGSGVNNCLGVSPSGAILPGGFHWLADPTNTCSSQASTTTGATNGSTGVSASGACGDKLAGLADRVVLLPVYSDMHGVGSGATFTINGWAAFKLLGWNFVGSGGSSYNNKTYPGATCSGSCKGLIGQFISFVSLDTRFTTGGPNLGASLVTLTK